MGLDRLFGITPQIFLKNKEGFEISGNNYYNEKVFWGKLRGLKNQLITSMYPKEILDNDI